jgi:hypothetical protein
MISRVKTKFEAGEAHDLIKEAYSSPTTAFTEIKNQIAAMRNKSNENK